MVKILVATWGNPWLRYPPESDQDYRWRKVKYCIEVEEGMQCEESESRTTLPLLVDRYRFDKVVIVVQDTVVDSVADSYAKLRKRVEEMYREFLKEVGLDGTNLDIVVAPGVGRYATLSRMNRVPLVFQGSLTDFYMFVLAEVSKILADAVEGKDELEVFVDLSHGLNYMPTLTYRAVKELASLAAWGLEKVVFRVLNSEPYVEGVKELHIHLVEDVELKPTTPAKAFDSSKPIRLLKFLEKDVSIVREIAKEFSSIDVAKLSAFLGSIANGLPLLLISTLPRDEELRSAIDRAIRYYIELTEITYRDTVVYVRHRVAFREQFEVLTTAWFLTRMLKRYVSSASDEVSLLRIDEIVKKVLGRNKKLRYMISRDIYELKEMLGSTRLNEWTPLYKLYPKDDTECSPENIRKAKDRFVRNFLAHSGFEICVTLAKHVDNEIVLRYRDELKDLIFEAAVEGLQIVS